MNRTRHWRQRWDPRAPLIFLRPVLLGGVNYVPGDKVPEDVRRALGGKMRQFWEGRFVGLDESAHASNAGLTFRKAATVNGADYAAGDAVPATMPAGLVQVLLGAASIVQGSAPEAQPEGDGADADTMMTPEERAAIERLLGPEPEEQ